MKVDLVVATMTIALTLEVGLYAASPNTNLRGWWDEHLKR